MQCANCKKDNIQYAGSCAVCNLDFCELCKLKLTPHGVPISLQGNQFCIKCVGKNPNLIKPASVWFKYPIKKWSLSQLSDETDIKLRKVLEDQIDKIYNL